MFPPVFSRHSASYNLHSFFYIYTISARLYFFHNPQKSGLPLGQPTPSYLIPWIHATDFIGAGNEANSHVYMGFCQMPPTTLYTGGEHRPKRSLVQIPFALQHCKPNTLFLTAKYSIGRMQPPQQTLPNLPLPESRKE